MNIHEYQAKELLRAFNIPVPNSVMVTSESQIEEAVGTLDVTEWVVKAQVHAGGRGKAGGVRIAKNKVELVETVRALLGSQLVTFQTDAKGLPVNQVLIETPSSIQKELYLGAVIDRVSQRIVFMASLEGGMEIEEVAKDSPEKIAKVTVDPCVGLQPYQCRNLFFALGLAPELMRQFVNIMLGLYKLFIQSDLSLVEINPLIISQDNQLICLDAKLNIDDNALYRQSQIANMRDADQEDPRENHAQEWELNYIALEGNIGCMVNGAGLAMATMDLIKLEGGAPANFLDVGGSATQERVAEAFKIITSDTAVKGILVNIFGGIVRCDLIAEGIISAVAEIGLKVPVVVRLEGNNAELGAKKLAESGLNIIAAQGFADAAKRIVQAVQ